MPEGRHRSRMTGSILAMLAAVLTVVPVLAVATPAQAHDYLVGSNPGQGSTLEQAPTQVSLEFNTAIGQQFAQVAVVDASGATYQSGDPVVDGAVVTQSVSAMPSGDITISYRVVSSDGHPIGGTVPFTIADGTSGGSTSGDATGDSTQGGRGADTAAGDAGSTGSAGSSEQTTADPASAETTPTSAATEDGSGVSPLVWVGAGVLALVIAGVTMVGTRRRRTTATITTTADETPHHPVGHG